MRYLSVLTYIDLPSDHHCLGLPSNPAVRVGVQLYFCIIYSCPE